MKKIGKQVAFLQTNDKFSRMGEGTFIRLKDGSIMHIFTQYLGGDWSDHADARIAGCISTDEGESFGETFPLFEKDEGALNIMSASALRLANGDIGIIYLRISSIGEGLGDQAIPYFCRSTDECKTFSDPIRCIEKPGFYVAVNDEIIQLKNGRIIFPVADHGESMLHLVAGRIRFVYSDDNGYTWNISDNEIVSPYRDNSEFQEPGIFEMDDNRLWCYFRTGYGHQYQSYSDDNGKTWTAPTPNFYFTAPNSPMTVKRVGKYTVAVFNPIPYNCMSTLIDKAFGCPRRSPFVCAVSLDGGRSFDTTGKACSQGALAGFSKYCFLLEDDTENSYCYPAIIETADGFLVAYYHSNDTNVCLNCTKITKVTFEELEKALAEA